MDSKPERFLTAEKKNVIVDSFVKWRIGSSLQYQVSKLLDYIAANNLSPEQKLALINSINEFFNNETTLAQENLVTPETKKQLQDAIVKKFPPTQDRLGDFLTAIRDKMQQGFPLNTYRNLSGGVATFYTTVGGDISQANLRLDQIIKDAFRSEFGKRNIRQLVSTDRGAIREILIKNSKSLADSLGMEIVDIQVMRIDLPEEVSSSVFRRMEAERERVAREFRSQGAEAAEKIRADADRQRVVTLANAFRDSEKIRGEGDAISADIYARAFGQNTEFFSFYRSLGAYKKTFTKSSMVILDSSSDFFQYFNRQAK
jgi:regulator of protease activity HflC (stomatin/prohibitin superfamily)